FGGCSFHHLARSKIVKFRRTNKGARKNLICELRWIIESLEHFVPDHRHFPFSWGWWSPFIHQGGQIRFSLTNCFLRDGSHRPAMEIRGSFG
ncbi:MAG: hypothetical protein LQ349_005537, partial [Xanthoria aureola]